MKKLSYKKPLVEVMDFDVTDILKTSGLDGTLDQNVQTAGFTYNNEGVMSIIATE